MSKRILVVEDDAFNRQLLKDLLELDGHEVVEADSVAGGTALLNRGPFDLVLLDIRLSGGRGEEVLRELRSRPDLEGTPAVAVTAFAMDGDQERFLASGFDAYVSKPISTRAFRAVVRSFVGDESAP